MTATLFAAAGEPRPARAQQWRLTRLQLINWGPFDGYHAMDIPQGVCLVTGESGSGKSSLLDAVLATLMPATERLNAASQEAASSDRSHERTVITYARGKYDTTRDPETGASRGKYLRGGGGEPVWAAVAMTWGTGGDRTFTAGRVWLVPPDARTLDGTTRRQFTTPHPFDLRALEPAARAGLSTREILSACPQLNLHGTYTQFRAELATTMQIGDGASAERALQLLAKVQQGQPFTTVDALFQRMVLGEPESLAEGQKAVAHFENLRQTHDEMVDARAKIVLLAPIEAAHERLSKAAQTTAALRGLRFAEPHATADTPYAFWVAGLRRQIAQQTAEQARRSADHERGRAEEAKAAADRARDRATALTDDIRAAGGEQLEELHRQLQHAREQLRDTADERRRIAALLTALPPLPETGDAWRALLREGEQFLAGLPEALEQTNAAIAGLRDERFPLVQRRSSAAAERDSLAGRSGRMPRDLHEQRAQLAAAMGVPEQALPFVAELLDTAPGHEQWRKAAELAMGGFARTLLVDQQHLPELRRAVNALAWARRIPFEGAQTGRPLPAASDAAALPGRLIAKPGSPFAGWLLDRIQSRFDYVCVDGPDELAAVPRGLTITGQTSEGRRGAHGGNAGPAILGFDNKDRIEDLAAEIRHLDGQLAALDAQIKQLEGQQRRWHDLEKAHGQARIIKFETIDTAAAEHHAEQLQRAMEELRAGNHTLAALQQQRELAAREEAEQRRLQHRAEYEHDQQQERADHLRAEAETAGTRRTALLQLGHEPTPLQASLLDEQLGTLPADLAALETSLDTLARALRLRFGPLAQTEQSAREQLEGIFRSYRSQYGDRSDLGTDPTEDYPGYADILHALQREGLPEARARFLEAIGRWTGEDLIQVKASLRAAASEVRERLNEINAVLAKLPYGPHGDTLKIESIDRRTPDQRTFDQTLTSLASNIPQQLDEDEALDRYRHVEALLHQLANPATAADRLDVRRHVTLEARRYTRDGELRGITTTTRAQSGGEAQETMAFVLAAALRYTLGGLDRSDPPYALVVLDEGYIKADSEFTARAIAAWEGNGFQVLMAAPPEKTGSIDASAEVIWHVAKGPDGRARAIDLVAREQQAGD